MFVFSYSRRDVEASSDLARVVAELDVEFGSVLRRVDDADLRLAEEDPVHGLLVVFGSAWRRELDEPGSTVGAAWALAARPQLRVVVVVPHGGEPVELPEVVRRRASEVLTFPGVTDGLVDEVAEAMLQRKPDGKGARDELDRGRIFYKERHYRLAIECFESALRRDGNYAEAALRLGMAHEAIGSLDQAVAAYERCLDIDPEHFHAATNIGEAYRKNERYEDAIRGYDRALASRDDYLYALAGRAECLRMIGDLPGALAWFDRALEVGSRHAFAIQGKAAALNTLQRYADALPLWRRAIELEPESAFAREGLEFCLQNLPGAEPPLGDELADARRQLESAAASSAIRIAPTLRSCLIRLARARGQVVDVPRELRELHALLRGEGDASALECLADWIDTIDAASATGRADPVVVVEMIDGIATLRDELPPSADSLS